MNDYVHFLEAPRPRVERLGGKGLNLCRLIAAGFPVPPGFVLTTAAYQAFVESNHLAPELRHLRLADPTDHPALEQQAQGIYERFMSASMPPEVSVALLDAFAQLRRRGAWRSGVAVRSSGIDEDSATHSYAGQYETFLNVPADLLVDKVKACWASLWSARSLAYRAGLDAGTATAPALAVVIQQTACADASGVVFTANPLSGSLTEVVVNATWGLGETLVSGRVTPDHYVIDKIRGALRHRQIGEKSFLVTLQGSGGTVERPMSRELSRKPVLSRRQLAQLTTLSCRIEALLQSPQDIEWCLAEGRLWIVQSRPISSLQEPWLAPGSRTWVHGGGAIELLTEPVSPIFETLFIPLYDRALCEWMTRLGLADALHWPIVRGVNGFIFACLDIRLAPRHLRALVRDYREHMTSMAEWPYEVGLYREEIERLSSQCPAELSSLALYDRLERLLQAALRYWIHVSMIAQPIYRAERRLGRVCKSIRGSHRLDPQILTRGLPMQPMAAEHSVYELAAFAAAATEPERLLGEVESGVVVVGSRAHEFRERLDLHLRRFGHQIYSFDPLVPTLVEDPRPVLAAVRTYLGGKESPDARFARLTAEREAAVTQIRQTLSPRRWRKFAGFLAAAQEAVSLRENALFELGRAWLPARQTLLALGQRLAHTTALDAPEDVFWLTRDELHTAAAELDADGRAGSLRDRSPARQRAWRRRQRLQPPYTLPLGSKPKFWWKYVFPVPELHGRSSGDVIRGTGVSPGRVTATARVVRTHEDIAHLQSGEILVARTTPPAWTPLLARAGGLVTDLGGPLAHGSIVAREYGIPAVMGTGSATQHIKDGQSIVVDGSSGCVFLA